MNRESPWEILGIQPTQDQREIRRAYALQAKSHHLEEDPQAFMKLNLAYRQALQYASSLAKTVEKSPDDNAKAEKNGFGYEEKARKISSDNDAETEEISFVYDTKTEEVSSEGETEDTENSLLSRLAQAEEEMMLESRKQGALHDLIALFEDPKAGKRAECWKEYFLSEAFLDEQFDENFGRGLVQYLENGQILPPKPFIVELAIAYGLQPDAYGEINAEGSFYNRTVAGMLWNSCSVHWNFPEKPSPEEMLNPKDFRVQDNPELMEKLRITGPERILMRAENLVRLRSFADYLTLHRMNRQGYLTEKERSLWEQILVYGRSNHLYEKNGKKGVYPETRSTSILTLYAHWIRAEEVPACVCKYIYQEYDLKNLEHSSNRHLYSPLKSAICKRFPQMEEELFKEGGREQMIRLWYQELMQIISDYHSCYDRREYGEPEAIRFRVEALFNRREWKQICHDQDLFRRMYLQIARRKVMPGSLAQKLCDFYQEEYPWPQPQQVREMQEGLVISMAFHQNLLEMDYRRPYAYKKTEIEDIDRENRDFWVYFFMVGFGSRHDSYLDSQQNQAGYAVGNKLYLPAYMQELYLPSMGWRKKFTGFDQKENAIVKPKDLEFSLPDGRRFKLEFHLHYIRYFLDDVPIIDPVFTFAKLLEIVQKMAQEKSLSAAASDWTGKYFFFLFAVTAVAEEERERAEKEILFRLKELPLAAVTFPLMAKMLAADNARTPLPEKETRRVQAVFYEEQERFCFKAEVYLRSLKTYRQTNFGWEEIALLEGEGKAVKALDLEGKKQYALQKLSSLRQPKPILLRSYSLEGLTNEEKMRRIIDALKEQDQYRKKRTHPYAPGFPWSPGEITPAVRRFFAEDGGWMLESFVLLQMGKWKNPCFERIFYAKMNIFGFDLSFQSPEFVGTLNTRTQALSQKIKEKHLVVGHFGWGKSYEARKSFAPMPFALGESGTFYAYDFLRLYRAETLEGLMDKLFDFSEVSRVDIYANRLSVSRMDHELEYCYTEEDFDEYLHGKGKKLPEIFTKFGI